MSHQLDKLHLSGLPSIEADNSATAANADFDPDDFADFADAPSTTPLSNIPQVNPIHLNQPEVSPDYEYPAVAAPSPATPGSTTAGVPAATPNAAAATIPAVTPGASATSAAVPNVAAAPGTTAPTAATQAAQAAQAAGATQAMPGATQAASATQAPDATQAMPGGTQTTQAMPGATIPLVPEVTPLNHGAAAVNATGVTASPELSVIAPAAVQTVIPATAGDLARTNEKYQSRNRKRGKRIRAIVGTIVILLLAYGIFQVAKGMFKADINERLAGEDSVAASNAKEALTPMVSTEPFYMMLIGSDVRTDDEDKRSDTNIVARIDPQTGVINVISIPRDTAINLEGYGTQKFNAAYAYYGAKGAIEAAEGLLGVDINHYAEIDFAGLVKLIDAVGGVDVDVPMRIEDANAGEQVIEAGPQHLNGEQALIFARSRSYTNGDFQRTANQRLLFQALLAKVSSMSALELAPVVSEAANCITTDLTVDQLQDYAQIMQDLDNVTVYSVMVPSKIATSEGISYVVCDTELLRAVMEAVSKGEDPSPLVNDSSVLSSAEAQEVGAESTPIYEPEID